MDIRTKRKSADADALSRLSGKRTVCGAKQIRKAILSGAAREVLLARNADPALTEPIEALCQANHVACTWVKSMTDLGNACGIEVGAAAAAVLQQF